MFAIVNRPFVFSRGFFCLVLFDAPRTVVNASQIRIMTNRLDPFCQYPATWDVIICRNFLSVANVFILIVITNSGVFWRRRSFLRSQRGVWNDQPFWTYAGVVFCFTREIHKDIIFVQTLFPQIKKDFL